MNHHFANNSFDFPQWCFKNRHPIIGQWLTNELVMPLSEWSGRCIQGARIFPVPASITVHSRLLIRNRSAILASFTLLFEVWPWKSKTKSQKSTPPNSKSPTSRSKNSRTAPPCWAQPAPPAARANAPRPAASSTDSHSCTPAGNRLVFGGGFIRNDIFPFTPDATFTGVDILRHFLDNTCPNYGWSPQN